MQSTIYIAADHGGFALKEQLVAWLRSNGHNVTDLGPETLVPDDDYPEYGFRLGQRVSATPGALGLAICRNGQGICVAAGKVKGVRAVTGLSPEQAASTRADDDANVLCLAADYQSFEEVKPIVEAWLGAARSDDERHVRRRAQIKAYEGDETTPTNPIHE